MKPDWQCNGIKLYHGDCLDILPKLADNSVDITVTSPPYNTLPRSHKPSGMRADRKSGVDGWMKRAAESYPDHKPEAEYQKWLHDIVAECLRVSQGLVWINHKIRYRNKQAVHPVRFLDFPLYAEVVWARPGSIALNCKRYAPSHEYLLAFGDKHYWDDSLNTLCSVWRLSPQRSDEHPCPFPPELVRRPIVSSCPPNGSVCDPFMGIGTVGQVSISEGRQFIGIEQERKYFDIAVDRISQAVKPTATRKSMVDIYQ